MLRSVIFFILIFSISLAPITEAQDTNDEPINNQTFNVIIADPNTIESGKILMEIKPGESQTDYILINNLSDVEQKLEVSAHDETKTEEGHQTLKTLQDENVFIGKWTSVDKTEVQIPPGEKERVNITVTIPPDTPLGTYEGGIAVLKRNAVKTVEEISEGVSREIIISRRIGTFVKVKVTDDPMPIPKLIETNIFNQAMTYAPGIAIFLASMGYLIYSNRKEKRGSNDK